MDFIDYYYQNTLGSVTSTYHEIMKYCDISREQYFYTAPRIKQWSLSHDLLMQVYPETLSVLQTLLEQYPPEEDNSMSETVIKEIIIGDQIAYIKFSQCEWKKINLLQYLNNSNNTNNDAYSNSGNENLESVSQSSSPEIKSEPIHGEDSFIGVSCSTLSNNYTVEDDADLDLNEIMNLFHANSNSWQHEVMLKFFEHNYWLKSVFFCHFEVSLHSTAKNMMMKYLTETNNLLERIKLFGFDLLLHENDLVDSYSFKLLQEVYRRNKDVLLAKSKLEVNLAQEFVESLLVENVLSACDENYFTRPKRRMDYTKQLKYPYAHSIC